MSRKVTIQGIDFHFDDAGNATINVGESFLLYLAKQAIMQPWYNEDGETWKCAGCSQPLAVVTDPKLNLPTIVPCARSTCWVPKMRAEVKRLLGRSKIRL